MPGRKSRKPERTTVARFGGEGEHYGLAKIGGSRGGLAVLRGDQKYLFTWVGGGVFPPSYCRERVTIARRLNFRKVSRWEGGGMMKPNSVEVAPIFRGKKISFREGRL